jgi:PAB-dependent poly(A)-specific ribonuclease subunit 2
LQLLKFTPLFRNLALQHTATACLFDTCLLCELGFLFDTMEKAEGQSCQATNFLKTFSSIPHASRMGLLEENLQGSVLADMIQSACRFLLQQTGEDYRRNSPTMGLFEQTIAVDALTSIKCVHCHNETIKHGGGYITDLIYTPVHLSGGRNRQLTPTFSQILKASVEVQSQTRGWCDKCRRYQSLVTRKSVRKMPDMLMINAALKSSEAKQYWSNPGWLPDSIGVIVDNGKFFCFEGEDLRLHLEKGLHSVKVYDLVGVVADVTSGEHQKSHLVSLINVDVFSPSSSEAPNWHLFNDFLVRKVPKNEALTFPSSWKLPTVISYQVASAKKAVDDTWKNNLDTSILYQSWSIK